MIHLQIKISLFSGHKRCTVTYPEFITSTICCGHGSSGQDFGKDEAGGFSVLCDVGSLSWENEKVGGDSGAAGSHLKARLLR